MKNSFFQEVVVSFVIIVLLLLLLNPLNFWMPDALLMMTVAILVVVFSAFAVFVWRENAKDEREHFHRLLAGRVGFLTGGAVLVAGIVFQSLAHDIDPWLLVTLGVMILAKVGGTIYSRLRR